MLNINIDEKFAYTLSVVAEKDAVTPEVWVERKINAILNQHKVDSIVATVKADIESYEPVIIAKKEEIVEVKRLEQEAYDLANPQPIKSLDIEISKEEATSTDKIIN